MTATCAITGAIEPEIGSVTNIKTTSADGLDSQNTGVIRVRDQSAKQCNFRAARARSGDQDPAESKRQHGIRQSYLQLITLRVAAYENPTGTADVAP